jgi:hypothetical protein
MNIQVTRKEGLHLVMYGVSVLGVGLSVGTLIQLETSQVMKLLIGQGLATALIAGIMVGYKIRGDNPQ